jgi:hypothetical protein
LPSITANGVGCSDPGHLDTCAALTLWRKLGWFEDVAECQRFRDAGVVAARSDDEWSDWQLSRCFPEERVRRGPLRPWE